VGFAVSSVVSVIGGSPFAPSQKATLAPAGEFPAGSARA
jgi:hypothetical protein